MTKTHLYVSVSLFLAVPASVHAQAQKASIPIAKQVKTATRSVKTHEKTKPWHPSAADRGLAASDLMSVVGPNGETRVVRRKKMSK
jgi:hypothetical protein